MVSNKRSDAHPCDSRHVHVGRRALHEHVHDVAQDALGGQQHHDAEHKRADRVGQVPARVVLVQPNQPACNGHADALQQVANHMQHCAAQVDAVMLVAVLLAVPLACMAVAAWPRLSCCCCCCRHWQLAADLDLPTACLADGAGEAAAPAHCCSWHSDHHTLLTSSSC